MYRVCREKKASIEQRSNRRVLKNLWNCLTSAQQARTRYRTMADEADAAERAAKAARAKEKVRLAGLELDLESS